MGTQPPAIRHEEIIAAVAALTERMAEVQRDIGRVERDVRRGFADVNGNVAALSEIVTGKGGHDDQIKAWRRDGKWVAAALTALGALGAAVLSRVFEWFTVIPKH
jgi:hypothetical protein